MGTTLLQQNLPLQVGSETAEKLILQATKYALWIRKQPYFTNKFHWLELEGGQRGVVDSLITEALVSPTWREGFVEYYNWLAREYGKDRIRNQTISIQALQVDLPDLEYYPLVEDSESEAGGVDPFGGLALGELYLLDDWSHHFFARIRKWDQLEQEILFCWAKHRSYKTVAKLFGISNRRVGRIVSKARKYGLDAPRKPGPKPRYREGTRMRNGKLWTSPSYRITDHLV